MTPARDYEDVFLSYVFPGGSPAAVRFREEVQELNLYCKRFKGAINCILLTGETGVGKNYTARGLSAHSQWLTLTDDERHALFDRNGQFIVPPSRLVDLMLLKQHRSSRASEPKTVQRLATVLGPQLADDLAASELFGHRKHAFTGANKDHPGIFGDESVEDILLDEIADMSPNLQTKLLQFIETRTFRPVGGLAADERISEHRLFLATNRPLEDFVRQGNFREDLYWRILGYRINIPPLRERRDIIRDVAYSVLSSVNYRQRGDQTTGPSLTPDADRYCLLPKSEWPSTSATYSNWVTLLRFLSAEDLVAKSTYARFHAAYRMQLVVDWLRLTGHRGLFLFVDELDNVVRQISERGHPACFRTLAWYCSNRATPSLRVVFATTPEVMTLLDNGYRRQCAQALHAQKTVLQEEYTTYLLWSREADNLAAHGWDKCVSLNYSQRLDLFRRITELHSHAWGASTIPPTSAIEQLARSPTFNTTRRWVRACVQLLDVCQQHSNDES